MKRLVLILDSLDKMYPENNKIHGGANKVGRYLIEYFSKLNDVQTDIICGISNITKPDNINEIISLGFDPFCNMQDFLSKAEQIVKEKKYDVVLTSDLFPGFGNIIVHSHTLMYKNNNCKTIIEKVIQSFLRRKKIKKFKANFTDKNRKIFTVSKRLANDYIKNLGFDKENIIAVYPGVEQQEMQTVKRNEPFVFGIVAGNAINKGGYLFLFAVFLLKLIRKDFKTKMIITKSKKTSLINSTINFLNIKDKTEVFPEQSNIEDFYKDIDCLVVPSINEAFGLVVTEAASFSTPSLVSHTAGSSEIITDFNNGFIFKRSSCFFKSLFNLCKKMLKILSLSETEYNEISKNAHLLSKNFTWYNYAREIAKELKLTI